MTAERVASLRIAISEASYVLVEENSTFRNWGVILSS